VWLVQGAAIYINIAAPCTTEIHTENQHFTLRVKPRVQPRFLHRLLILCFSCNPVIPKNKKSPKHFPFSVKIPIFASVPRAERSNAAKPAQLPNRYRLPNFLLFKSYLPTDYKKTIVFYKKNNEKINKNVVLLYCIALSMHIASLIFLPVFYKYKSVSKKNVILLFVITFVIGSITTHYFSDFYALGALIGKGQYLQNNAERFYQYMMTLPLFALGTMFVLFTDEGHLKLIEYRSLYFAVVFNNLFSIVDYSDRTIVYFLFPLLVLIPNAFNYMKIKILYKVIAFAVFVAYYSYKYYSVLNLYSEFQNDSPVPYRSCLY